MSKNHDPVQQNVQSGNGDWQSCTTGVVMIFNGTVNFKATDTAGHETVTQYMVSNIDKIAPEKPKISLAPEGGLRLAKVKSQCLSHFGVMLQGA